MAKLYYVNIASLDENSIDLLSSFRKEKAKQYVFDKDKKSCVAGGIALNNALKEYNLEEKNVEYYLTKNGKPYIKNRNDIYFNISHSNKIAICAISNKEVGCDIEKITKCNEKVMSKCFSQKEIEYINNSNNKDESFTRIWVYKESFFKAIGIGLNDKMKECTILPLVDGIFIDQNVSEKKWSIKEFRYEDYIVAVCEEI